MIDIKLTIYTLIPFLCLFFWQFIRYTRLVKHDLSTNEISIQKMVHSGLFRTLKSFFSSMFILFFLFFVFIFLINIYYKIHYLRFILMVLSFFSSFTLAYFSLGFFFKLFMEFQFYLKNNDYFEFQIKNNPVSILISAVVSILMVELLLIILLLKFSLQFNWFNFLQLLNDLKLIDLVSSDINAFIQSEFSNIFILTIISGYFFGIIFHSFFARLISSSLAVSADTSADLIGYTNYDLPENDIRNVAVVSDFIGDYLKNAYSTILTISSTMLTAVFFVSFFGAIFGVVNEQFDAFVCILVPFHLIAVGLIVYSLYSFFLLFKKNNSTILYFFGYLSTLFFTLILWARFVSKLFSLKQAFFIPVEYLSLLIVVFLFSAILYLFLWFVLSKSSKFIKAIVESNHLGIFSSLSKGFSLAFIFTFIIGLVLALFVAFVYLIFGFELNIYRDLFNLGIVVILLIIIFMPLFQFVLTYPLIDNISGLAQMLVYPQDECKKLIENEIDLSSFTAIFHILISVIVILLLPLFTFFLLFVLIRHYVKLTGNVSELDGVSIEMLLKFNIDFHHILNAFEINILNPEFIAGMISGVVILMFTYGFIMSSYVKNYEIVNHYFSKTLEDTLIWEGKTLPNYIDLQSKLVFHTKKTIRLFFVLFILILIALSFMINIAGMIGFVISTAITAFVFGVFFILIGTLWGNAKKKVDMDDSLIGLSSHVSIMMCDKLGDIFKDGLGPISFELTKIIILFMSLIIGMVLVSDSLLGILN
ncbi:MAG: sodium/proton-translocating pyrophosphatase [Candidatus Margulisiibacteriota bacterium]